MAARLSQVKVGDSATIDHVEGADATTLRLFELGLLPGAVVTVTRKAPLGDPLELFVCGTRLCVRHHDAARFIVVESTT